MRDVRHRLLIRTLRVQKEMGLEGKSTLEILSSLEAARKREGELRNALRMIDKALTVPAAEYVPAISDAFQIIDKTLNRLKVAK